MYIINLTYNVPLETVDQYLEAHIDYLNQQYEAGFFVASGRKVPRTGGIILSKLTNSNQLLEILHKDPFYIHQVAHYELIEFLPTKTCPELEFLKAT